MKTRTDEMTFRKAAALIVLFFVAAVPCAQAEKIGRVTFTIGKVSVTQGDAPAMPMKQGMEVEAGARIETGESGQAHIRFIDSAIVVLRPESVLTIEEYKVNLDKPSENTIRFKLDKGVLRSVTGKAGEMAKERFRLNTPIAAIGIKGTDFITKASSTETDTVVLRGGVVMAPLEGQCAQLLVGPCNSAFSRDLTAETQGYFLRMTSRQASPELVPLERIPDGMVVPINSAKVRPALSAEPPTSSIARPAQDVREHEQKYPGAAVDSDSRAAKPIVTVQPRIWWGRWQQYADPQQPGTSYAEQMRSDREAAGGRGVFGLLREKSVTYRMPTVGSADFSLARSEAYVVNGSVLSPASVVNGGLHVDFNRSTFDTRLTVAADGAAHDLASQGKIQGDGRFVSRSGQATGVSGVLSSGATQAGYAFNHDLGNGRSLSGATLWSR